MKKIRKVHALEVYVDDNKELVICQEDIEIVLSLEQINLLEDMIRQAVNDANDEGRDV